MKIRFESERFGAVEADARDLIEFPGLPGFPHARRFLVRRHDRGSDFAWLLCADDPALAFVIATPWRFVPDYDPEIAPRWLRALGADDVAALEIVSLATVSGGAVTLNLAAPILIHPPTRRGMQVILEGEWPLRAPALPAAAQIESNPGT